MPQATPTTALPPCTSPQRSRTPSCIRTSTPGSHTPAAAKSAAKPKLYNPRHPEHTLLYRTVAEHFETWFELASAGQFDGQGDNHTPPRYVEQAFRKYLERGIFAHGFARARCEDCGHDLRRLLLQGPWCLPLVQHPAHGRGSGAPG